MFLLYLGEKGTEEHIVTEDEVERGCFLLNERAEFGSVFGSRSEECFMVDEYETKRKQPANDRNGTKYVSFDNMKTGDKIQVQYAKYVFPKKGKKVGQFNDLEQEKLKNSPKCFLTFLQLFVLNEEFVNLLKSGKKIEVLECRYVDEGIDEEMKYFFFGFKGYLPIEGDTFEVRGTADDIIMCSWNKK